MAILDKEDRVRQLEMAHNTNVHQLKRNNNSLQQRLEEVTITLKGAKERARLRVDEHERSSPLKDNRLNMLEMENRDLCNKVAQLK